MKVLGIIGSVRSKWTDVNALQSIESFEQAYDYIYPLGLSGNICNTDGMMIAALAGARHQGCKIELLHQGDSVPHRVAAANGIIFGTPVYFGEHSSHIQLILDIIRKMEDPYPLLGKVVGFVSVGAKRNGGTETANLIGLHKCFDMGADVVGNGPPICQSGGTGVAGHPGSIKDDNYGLQSAFETGRQVGRFVKTPTSYHFPPKLYVLDMSVETTPCLGCPTCPGRDDGGCRQNGEIDETRRFLLKSDGILIDGSVSNYDAQCFKERTRSMRRNDFELSYIPMGFLEKGDDPLLVFRGIQYAQRQNTIAIGPGPKMSRAEYVQHFRNRVVAYHQLRQANLPIYKPVGY